MRRRPWLVLGLLTCALPSSAAADDFAAGSLIIPMDTDYQDLGMLRAYGLVYELLRQNVPVRWMIKTGKANGDIDFTASAIDLQTNSMIDAHGYRGGPWVIDAQDADEAMSVIEGWQAKNPTTVVHQATGPFTGDVARTLVVAPTIAMMADGNQKIARTYMVAAGIPDSTGNLLWPDVSPDMLDPDELAGPDTMTVHNDGALFDEDGDPVYCQFMSMHWDVNDAAQNPDVVAEMRAFLQFPTHLFAECQAVNAFENLAPHGFFLTDKGFLFADQPNAYDFFEQDTPFAQLDGAFKSVGGSEPAYSLPPGEMYKGSDVVMITEAGTPIGVNDVWMTGFIDGVCPGLVDLPDELSAACLTAGKVSYLGGHQYTVKLPISANPTTQGTRLFLNSLFEAPCATAEGLPQVAVTKTAPAVTDTSEVTFDIDYVNTGPMPALEAVLTDTLPPGVTFVSATDNGMQAGGVVTWQLGNLGPDEGGTVHVTVDLGAPGIYANSAVVNYRAGVNDLSVASNQTMTAFGVDPETGGETSGTGETGGTMGATGETGGTMGATGTGGSASATEGSASATGTGGSASATGETGGSATGTGGSASATGGSASATGGASDTVPTTGGAGGEASSDSRDASEGSGSGTAGETPSEGCGCRGDASGRLGVFGLLGLVALRRRRRGVRGSSGPPR